MSGNDCWVIAADTGPIAGMIAAARSLGGKITAVAAGGRALADKAAAAGPDEVRWFAPSQGSPPETLAPAVARDIAAAAPRVILSLPDAASRVLWAAAAFALGAPAAGAVTQLRAEGDLVLAVRPAAQGKALETIGSQGLLAAVFDAADITYTGPAAPVTEMRPAAGEDKFAAALRLAPGADDGAPEESGLRAAARVIGVGLGVRKRERLAWAESLAAALDAVLACSLPVSDDLEWFGESRVIGISSNRIAPQLYLALGISGQPQHMSGVRDARIVAAVNNDPEAPVFNRCHYGIEGDLAEILPALIDAVNE
ncbi:MAG: FAD-binding protein [Gracilibacteraceae bacterium]|nr:FAD-binding protein [Gracilibacteraceae bacterium]